MSKIFTLFLGLHQILHAESFHFLDISILLPILKYKNMKCYLKIGKKKQITEYEIYSTYVSPIETLLNRQDIDPPQNFLIKFHKIWQKFKFDRFFLPFFSLKKDMIKGIKNVKTLERFYFFGNP